MRDTFTFVSLRVRLVERGSPHSLPLMESGKVSERDDPDGDEHVASCSLLFLK